MDENGALYYLATYGHKRMYSNPHVVQQVKAFASSVGAGSVEDFVGRVPTNCRTHNEPFSYFGVDLGQDRKFLPSSYTIRNRASTTHVLLNWNFEGSIDGINWIALDRRIFYTGNHDEDAQYDAVHKELC